MALLEYVNVVLKTQTVPRSLNGLKFEAVFNRTGRIYL